MSGRRTSLRVSMVADASDPFVEGGKQYRLQSTQNPVTAFVSSARSNAWYEPSRPSTDPRVVDEIALVRKADGIIFVWDVQSPRTQANCQELAKLIGDLGENIKPIVCIANKRDCANQIGSDDLKAHLKGIQIYDAVASNGTGCKEALAALLDLIDRSKTT